MITFERLAKYLEAKLGIEIYGVRSIYCNEKITLDCNDNGIANCFNIWTRDLPEKEGKRALVYAFLNKHEDMNLFRNDSQLIKLSLEWKNRRDSISKFRSSTAVDSYIDKKSDRMASLAKIAKYTESQIELDMAILGI